MTYIIAGSYWDPTSGGQRVLAYLCHHLNEMGQHAWMPPHYNLDTGYDLGGLNLPRLTTEKLRYWIGRGAVVVYPEVTPGNPFGAERVVRWVLAPPGTQRNVEGTCWQPGQVEGETVYVFHQAKMGDMFPEAPELYVTAVEHQWFHARERTGLGACLYQGKWVDEVPKGASVLPRIERSRFGKRWHRKELADYLRSKTWMLCLDYDTFLMSEAGLCGCYSVLPPNSMFTREQYERSRLGLVGVAYGTEPEELERAAREVEPDQGGENAVSRQYAEAEEISREEIRRFVEETAA